MNEIEIFEKYEYIRNNPDEFDLYNAPVAVFDSGVGGISVLRELVRIMPNENFLYFGDSKNAPYGTKTTEEVKNLTIGYVSEFMMRPIKGCVIACNTATSAAVRPLRELYPNLPLVGIEPALKPAALNGQDQRVLVMATPMTIREEKFHKLLSKYEDIATVYPLACPGLMEYVESGKSLTDANEDDILSFLENLLCDYKSSKIDSVVLGCTHYPFVRDEISKVLGQDVKIFDGGLGTAREMHRRLEEAGLLRRTDSPGEVVFENSLNSPAKIELCRQLLLK